MGHMNINKNMILSVFGFIAILVLAFYMITPSKSTPESDIVITSITSSNSKLKNILKDNYLLIDSSYLKKYNEIKLLIKNNSNDYDFYVDIDCNDIASYSIYSDIDHLLIKANTEVSSNLMIDVLENTENEFLKCYLKYDIK